LIYLTGWNLLNATVYDILDSLQSEAIGCSDHVVTDNTEPIGDTVVVKSMGTNNTPPPPFVDTPIFTDQETVANVTPTCCTLYYDVSKL